MSQRASRALGRVLCLSGALALSAATPERAMAEGGSGALGLHVGARTGFGLPLGHYAEVRSLAGFRDEDVNALSDDTYGVIPLWIDAGYRPNPHWMLGGYFVFGLVLPKTAEGENPLGGGCPEGLDCFATGVRFGVQAQYRFAPAAKLDPWLGVGLGYEWITADIEGELFNLPFDASTSHAGPDLLQLQGGLDVEVGGLELGPFVAVSALQYTSCSATLNGESIDCELADAGWHGWLMLGVRGALEL